MRRASSSSTGTVFARFAVEYVEAALAAQGRELVVVDAAEVDDDLVPDMTDMLTSFCARLYGKRASANRARRVVELATSHCPRPRWRTDRPVPGGRSVSG